MASTSRISLYRPIGTLSATANAGGTTTTMICSNASVSLAIGDRFRLFTSADAPKEDTIFTVTNKVVAGSTTLTFTPAAAVSTANTDRAYNGEIIDVNTAIDNQLDILDTATIVEACTSSTRPSTNLYTGKLIYETDTKNIMKYSGSVWEVIQNVNFPRGRVGYSGSAVTSAALTFGQEALIQSVTFTAYAGRTYACYGGGTCESVTGTDVAAYVRVRWQTGATVSTATGASIGTQAADVNDNGVAGANSPYVYANTFVPNVNGQITAGLFFGNAQSSGTDTCRTLNFSYLAIEDLGAG